ncbi:glycine--tRNA ligase subunit beta [Desulfofalx alkaliphila]|uniref:glycine--tRNA ligase subunit beta n=1 Tax=Desulfofalx alkaliphila TaxID=105483 RepID=UPI0004E17037|nr:glycine--tRNA ligase subunit beta [Desulfofalx alkaliphila]
MAKDFLLEIGIEEMPARFMAPALKQLKELTEKTFKEQRLEYQEVKTFGTPRRLVLHVKQLNERQQSLTKEVKGPAQKAAFDIDGNPTKAVLGFARSQGVKVEDLVVRPLGKVDYMYAIKKEDGLATDEVLAQIAPQLISGLHFPKPMRWGSLDYRFARPIRWLLALYGSELVPFTVAEIKSGRHTYGHRFLSRGTIEVADPDQYFKAMIDGYVMVDGHERRRVIWQQVQELAASVGGTVQQDDELLEEIANIVEYPTALMGSFAEHYLNLPDEVIITPMREHQRYFPIVDQRGKLMPKFITVRNGTSEHLDIVTAGNEKVLSARLADAEFFFKEDLKTPLADKVDKLKKVVWLEGLGSVYEKVERIGKLALSFAEELDADKIQIEHTARAALLAKADLVTNMVYEFPELQGIIGREYALRSGEEAEVGRAIFEHYLPCFAGDQLPSALPGQVISLADKMDSIVGCFAVGIQPTGSQDPYALRRQALGVTNIILEYALPLSLKQMIVQAYNGYQGDVEIKLSIDQVTKEVTEFFKVRIKGALTEGGLTYDIIDAVLEPGFDNFADTWQRGQALAEFRKQPAFNDLLTAFNRANNLAKKSAGGAVKENLLQEEAEKDLYQAYISFSDALGRQMSKKNYQGALQEIALLLDPINKFFDQVMVMVEDEQVKNNRLALLFNIANKMKKVADFSKIVA